MTKIYSFSTSVTEEVIVVVVAAEEEDVVDDDDDDDGLRVITGLLLLVSEREKGSDVESGCMVVMMVGEGRGGDMGLFRARQREFWLSDKG